MDEVSKAQLQKPATRHKSGFRGPSPDVGKATQWKKGQSGNPAGRPKPITKIFQELLDDGVSRNAIKGRVRSTLTEKGMAGVLLLREAAERVEGKVAQPIEVEGDVSVSLALTIEKRRKARGNGNSKS